MTTGAPGVRILVVDDEPDIKLIIQQKFRKHMREQHWQFEFAHNGEEALQVVRTHPDIDVVLTDINMPIMDGLTLLRELNGLDRELRAVVISAYGDLVNIRSAMNLGAFDFVTKPIDLGDLESTIVKTLALVQRLKEARRMEREAVEAAAVQHARSRFLADMGQELRTPLNAIILFTDLVIEEAEDEGARFLPDLRKIKAAGSHLLTFINDVVDMSRLEAGHIELTAEEFDVHDMVAEVADIVHGDIARNGNRLDVKVDDACSTMCADVTRVRQILFNILVNAARSTQNGTVGLHVTCRGDRNVFRISDTGRGMTAEEVEALFRPYTQLTVSTGASFGESGLALIITRRLCDMLGGRIELESEPGRGSTFTVDLPARSQIVYPLGTVTPPLQPASSLLRIHRWMSEPPANLSEEDIDVYGLGNYAMVMCLSAHVLFGLVFLGLGLLVPAAINVFSVSVFITGLMLTKRGQSHFALYMASAEVMAHAWMATVYVGWTSGFHFYVLLCTCVIYLFTRIPLSARIAISVFQLVGYVGLALYSANHLPIHPVSPVATQGLAVMNIVILILVLSGMLSYYSYAVRSARRLLRDQNERLETAFTRLREAQDQMVAQQKLAHLGTLTAGIAHEIKNPLNFVNNFAALSLDALTELTGAVTRFADSHDANHLAEVRDNVDILQLNAQKVQEHGKRADRVVQSMLLHAGRSSGEREPTDLNALVLQTVELARSGAHGNLRVPVEVAAELDSSLPQVQIAPRDVARALLNIIGNAVHAAGERSVKDGNGHRPRVSVTTQQSGSMAVVRVRDNGYGIPADVRERIFTPFFTTRPSGEGTGLGLSISNDIIVGQHKGRLSVVSTPGEFAEFVIELPA